MNIKESYIIDGVRSPIGTKNGNMLGIRPDDLAALTIKDLLLRNKNIIKDKIEDISIGCAFPEGPQGMLVSKGISVLSGLPVSVAANVINRFCGSSMDAVHNISRAIGVNDINLGIAGGVEDMFSVPMGGFNPSFNPILYDKDFYINMGETAENLAKELSINRSDQEEFSIDSHKKAINAINEGLFKEEIVPIHFNEKLIENDEGPRIPDIEKMKSLDPAFDSSGTITAATSSPISIGSAMLLLASKEGILDSNLKPKFKIISRSVAGVEWTHMGKGPIPATERALKNAGLNINDIDAIELNEAFAAQSLYVIRKMNLDVDIININGGAIALGHPLGCSGSRILITLMNVMEQNDFNLGLATMCIGSGQGIATIIERVN